MDIENEKCYLVWRKLYDEENKFIGIEKEPQILFESTIRECPPEFRKNFLLVPLTTLADLPVG